LRLRKHGRNGHYAAIIITFMTMGLWHGANWTFIAFGGVHGGLLIYERRKKAKRCSSRINKRLLELIEILSNFLLVCITIVLFRSVTISDAITFYFRLFITPIGWPQGNKIMGFLAILCLVIVDWVFIKNEDRLKPSFYQNLTIYIILSLTILLWPSVQTGADFIYFQF